MASTQAIILSLTKTIIGAGMLALPFSYHQQGAIFATCMIIIAAITTGTGLFYQSICAGYLPKGRASFAAVCKITYPRLAIIFDLAIAIKCFGVAVSYLIITGNLCPIIANYFGAPEFLLASKIWITLAVISVGPLCFKKTLESLKFTSIVGLASAAYLVILVVGHYFAKDTLDDRGPVSLGPSSIGNILTSMPIVLFSYTCAQNMFQAMNELGDDSPGQVILLIVTCLGGSCTVYVITGICGYLSFGDNVTDNIIAMYPQSVLSTMGRLAMVVLVLFSYPLQIHPARASVVNIVKSLKNSETDAAPLLADDDTNQAQHVQPITETESDKLVSQVSLVLLVASYLIAISVSSLEVVLSFVGAVGATSISFILPGIFGYKLSSSTSPNRIFTFTPKAKQALKVTSICLTAWGIVTFVLGLGSNIYRLIK